MADRTDFENEVETHIDGYKSASVQFRDSCWNAYNFLHQDPLAVEALGKLETELDAQIALKTPSLSAATRQTQLTKAVIKRVHTYPRPAQNPDFSKLLSEVLLANEKANGFLTPPKTFLGFIPGIDFLQQVGSGYHWKDSLVPAGHGEFTHRIQWYLLMKERANPDMTWTAFYKEIALRSADFTLPAGNVEKISLWDAIFDRNPYSKNNSNGPFNTSEARQLSSPENLHAWMLNTSNTRTPILSVLIYERSKKREVIFSSKSIYQAFVVKKKYPGRTYNQLTVAQQTLVDDIMKKDPNVPSGEKIVSRIA